MFSRKQRRSLPGLDKFQLENSRGIRRLPCNDSTPGVEGQVLFLYPKVRCLPSWFGVAASAKKLFRQEPGKSSRSVLVEMNRVGDFEWSRHKTPNEINRLHRDRPNDLFIVGLQCCVVGGILVG